MWRLRCGVACGVYAVLVVVGVAFFRTMLQATSASGTDGRALTGRLSDAAEQIDRNRSALAAAETMLSEAESQLRASRAITDQPDWSQLLALLARKSEGQVVLRACIVRPREMPAVAAPRPGMPKSPPAEPAILVNLSGLGTSQGAVSEYALRLESTGLFQRVALLDTTREPIDGLPLVAFRIECTLTDRGPAGRASVAGGDR
jgi:hypothetical protein